MFSLAIAQRGLNSPYDLVIQAASLKWGVDTALIQAVIARESAWLPDARRLEPDLQDASHGLMQLLGATARWLGYSGEIGSRTTLTGLYDPATNINLGAQLLARQLARYATVEEAVSSYNQGTSLAADRLRFPDGHFRNQTYVDDVMAYYQFYQAAEPEIAPQQMGMGGIGSLLLLGGGIWYLWGRRKGRK